MRLVVATDLATPLLPAAGLDQVVEEERDDVVGLDEGAVGVDDAEAIRIAVGGDPKRARLIHSSLQSPSRWSSGSGAWPPKRTSR